jgi:glycosyl transferase, family 25
LSGGTNIAIFFSGIFGGGTVKIAYLCVNLARAPERKAFMQAQADEFGIELEFIDAVDGQTIDIAEVADYAHEERLKYAPDLKPNQVACVLSHKMALRQFLESDADAAVVLEDDAVFGANLVAFVSAAASLPFEWDAINLENRNGKPLQLALAHLPGSSVCASAWLSKGSTAYLYSRKGADRVEESLTSFRHGFDTHLGHFWKYDLVCLCAHPALVTQADMPTTIGNARFREADLTWRQFVRSRLERIRGDFSKEIYARVMLARLQLGLYRRAQRAESIAVKALEVANPT